MIGIELNAFDSLNDKSISIIDDTQRSITGAQKIDETTWEYFDQVTFALIFRYNKISFF